MLRSIDILLVEDETVDAMTVRRAIKKRELAVALEICESAEAALDRLRVGRGEDASEDAYCPDLILADLRLPRLSGVDLLERVKSDPALRRVPFVMLSTSSQEVEIDAAYDLGAAGYFVKPVSFEDYADLIEAIVIACARAEPFRTTPSRSPSRPKRAQMHYLESELHALFGEEPQTFEFLQSRATDGIWFWDLESPEHEWMSPGFWRTFGYDPASKPHLSAAWQDMVDPVDLESALVSFEKHCADSAHPYDHVVRYRHRDGSTVYVRCRGFAIRDREGKPVRMLGAHTDVTEQEAARRRAESAEAKLRAVREAITSRDRAPDVGSVKALLDRVLAIVSTDSEPR